MNKIEDAFDERPAISNEAIASLVTLAEEQVSVEQQLKDIEELTSRLKSRSNALKTQLIPDKMAEIGLSEFKLPSGAKVAVEDFVSGSLPKDVGERAAAIAELETWGEEATSVIKGQLLVTFEKRQHNAIMALADELRAKGWPAEVTSTIHPQTYLALIRDRIKSGANVAADALGVFIGRKAKVTIPKNTK